MKTQKDFLEALLAGKTLINRESGVEVKMDFDRGYIITGERGAYFTFFDSYTQFDIKPKTLLIGNKLVNLPEPMRVIPKVGTTYWTLDHDISSEITIAEFEWQDDGIDMTAISNGTAFETEEDASLLLKIFYDHLISIMSNK